MHDPGDEHPGGDAISGIVGWANACPFCHGRMGYANTWRVPLRGPRVAVLITHDAVELIDAPLEHCTLDTCGHPDCIAQAKRFQRQHEMSPQEKQIRAYRRWH